MQCAQPSLPRQRSPLGAQQHVRSSLTRQGLCLTATRSKRLHISHAIPPHSTKETDHRCNKHIQKFLLSSQSILCYSNSDSVVCLPPALLLPSCELDYDPEVALCLQYHFLQASVRNRRLKTKRPQRANTRYHSFAWWPSCSPGAGIPV